MAGQDGPVLVQVAGAAAQLEQHLVLPLEDDVRGRDEESSIRGLIRVAHQVTLGRGRGSGRRRGAVSDGPARAHSRWSSRHRARCTSGMTTDNGPAPPQDHVQVNRAYWDVKAAEFVGPGRKLWAQDEPTWGIWGVPQAQ